MEMQIYVANLGKYNEGKLVGAWFTPPIDYETMKEKIGLNAEYKLSSKSAHFGSYKNGHFIDFV